MGYRLQVSAKLLNWPRSCACCGSSDPDSEIKAKATRTTGKKSKTTTESWWHVPYCTQCANHCAKHEKAGKVIVYGMLAFLGLWLWIGTNANGIAGFIVGACALGFALWRYSKALDAVTAMMKSECAAPGPAVEYVEWHGTTHTFVFQSESYLERFMYLNRQKSMSDVRKV